ncbi:hypothetical protein DXB01_08230 [Clostridium sp. OF10-22XD]|nr:hypothetical protein DXB01_08230 [Clostridium sp. OF10-22XD]
MQNVTGRRRAVHQGGAPQDVGATHTEAGRYRCGTPDGSSIRIEALSDCRSIVCKKIGPHAKKLLERKAIAAFDVDCSVEEALKKIIFYYNRTDRYKK